MRRILVPPRPGAFSALGLLCTDVVHDYIRSELWPLDRLDAGHAERYFREPRGQGRGGTWPKRGSTRSAARVRARTRHALCRPGLRTAHAARRAVGAIALDAAALAAARARFDDVHARIHGHAAGDGRRSRELSAAGARRVPKFAPQPQRGAPAGAATARSRQGDAPRVLRGATSRRRRRSTIASASPSARSLRVPPSSSSSTRRRVVPPGWHASVDRYGNLILERKV